MASKDIASAEAVPQQFLKPLIATNPRCRSVSLPPTRLVLAALAGVTLVRGQMPRPRSGTKRRTTNDHLHYAYSGVTPAGKPADAVLQALKDIPEGTPAEEVRRAARISGPTSCSWKRWSRSDQFRSQAAHRLLCRPVSAQQLRIRSIRFRRHHRRARQRHCRCLQIRGGRDPVRAGDAPEGDAGLPLSDPSAGHSRRCRARRPSGTCRPAKGSMCATEEGRKKGERWCKRAIWQITLPDVKRTADGGTLFTSAAFVAMWAIRRRSISAIRSALSLQRRFRP